MLPLWPRQVPATKQRPYIKEIDMPGPTHKSPRHPGNRPDPAGNPRRKNRKTVRRLSARQTDFGAITPTNLQVDGSFHRPGSQNRNKR